MCVSIQPIVHQINSLGLLPPCTTTTEQVEIQLGLTIIYSLGKAHKNKYIYKTRYPPYRVRQQGSRASQSSQFSGAAWCLGEVLFLFLLTFLGKVLLAHSSVPGSNGGGVEAKASVGAIQPEVAAIPVSSASWRYTSRLTGSAGLASNGLKKRVT